MAENKNNFDTTVASLFKGMDSFVSAKTVVGDAVTVNEPLFFRWLMYRLVWVQVHLRAKRKTMRAAQ